MGLLELRTLHYLSRAGALSPGERIRYRFERAELFAQLLRAQTGDFPSQRTCPRVPRALPVVLRDGPKTSQGLTLQLSSGGFAMYLDAAPSSGPLSVTLELEDAPLTCIARSVACVRHGSNAFFVCIAFEDLSELDRERIEDVLVDATLDSSCELPPQEEVILEVEA